MTEEKKTFYIRSKVWIEDEDGNVVFGLGRMRILEAIERLGSINAAAKALKMGYRAIWGRITASEERLGKALLVRNIGGSSGGGSQLTPYAKSLMEKFRNLHRTVEIESDALFENVAVSGISPEHPIEKT
ncbi:winged helix-turn-helix domain-containing protein [Desulfococcus multivorans]|nr:LysR family transcriptional regulator [Desulfococcus multivorans]AOY58407.1 putative molybdenum transport regulatory protein [Desulfococcus multivorans]